MRNFLRRRMARAKFVRTVNKCVSVKFGKLRSCYIVDAASPLDDFDETHVRRVCVRKNPKDAVPIMGNQKPPSAQRASGQHGGQTTRLPTHTHVSCVRMLAHPSSASMYKYMFERRRLQILADALKHVHVPPSAASIIRITMNQVRRGETNGLNLHVRLNGWHALGVSSPMSSTEGPTPWESSTEGPTRWESSTDRTEGPSLPWESREVRRSEV